MRTLDLVLKGEWYDMITSGEKTEEYRELSDYWIKRLLYPGTKGDLGELISYGYPASADISEYCRFAYVRFRRGYTNISMTYKIKAIRVDEGRQEWGARRFERYFVIKLGERQDL